MKKTFSWIKQNIFSVVCVFMAMAVFVTGGISYSKYVSSDPLSEKTNVGSFTCTASIDSVSALSFTNTAFWGGSTEDVEMNALRTLDFSVNNFKADENGNVKISEVKMRYDLTFSAPKNFAEKLAFQVFDASGNALIPQIVIADLISKGESGESFDTSKSKDYNATTASDLTFSVSKNDSATYFCATSGSTVVTVEEYVKENVEQTLLMRTWDTSSVTSKDNPTVSNESGKLQPPLTVNFKSTIPFYRISVRMDSFLLPANVQTTVKHSVQLAPTDTIDDEHLGGTFVELEKDENDNVIDFKDITSIYGGSKEKWFVQTVREQETDEYYSDASFSGTPLKTISSPQTAMMGAPKIYKVGDTFETVTSSTEDAVLKAGDKLVSLSESEVTWGTPTVTDKNAPTKSSYNDENAETYVRMAIREQNNYGTIFYVHKLEGKQTGKRTVTKTTYEVLSDTPSSIQTDVTESSLVKSVTGVQEEAVLEVTKTTKTTAVGNFTVKTTVETYEETVEREGFFYLGYYVASEGQTLKFWDDAQENLISSDGNNTVYKSRKCFDQYGNEASNLTVTNTGSSTTNVTESEQKTILTDVKKEYLKRDIKREFKYSEILLSSVVWAKRDENGNAVYDENNVLKTQEYDERTPLNFYEESGGVLVQKLYLSQCYSKTYPFSVNVIFEQVLQ